MNLGNFIRKIVGHSLPLEWRKWMFGRPTWIVSVVVVVVAFVIQNSRLFLTHVSLMMDVSHFRFFLSRIFDKKQNKVEVDMQCNKNDIFFRKKLSQVLAIFSFPVHKVFGLVTKPNSLTPKYVLKRQKMWNYKMTIMPKCFDLKKQNILCCASAEFGWLWLF